MTQSGIYPRKDIAALIDRGAISSADPVGASQIQPASLDMRLGTRAYRLRASFLPGARRTVADCLTPDLVMHEIDLSVGAVLETGCVYLVELQEALALPSGLSAAANPKSSTGRLDVFTRVITDKGRGFDQIEAGYNGPLYVEIAPRTFSVLAKKGETLVQIRFREGAPKILRSETVSIDLSGIDGSDIIGWRARRHAGLVRLDGRDHSALDYWEPLRARGGRLILDPEEFYILASKEAVKISANEAAEMAPVALEIGEFRAHYAGFFDPGFGLDSNDGKGSRAVLEVRGRDVPFILEDGQPVARLVFEPMRSAPDGLYGDTGSHYQSQGLRLSKHFVL
ncbi:MAG: 2'-deoxycytidine 5'-triphosphate deaminase [Robiginitomaculum sp.]